MLGCDHSWGDDGNLGDESINVHYPRTSKRQRDILVVLTDLQLNDPQHEINVNNLILRL